MSPPVTIPLACYLSDIVKMCFYSALFLGGCSAPLLCVLIRPIDRRSGFKGFLAIYALLTGSVFFSVVCMFASIKLSSSRIPLIGMKNDPFLEPKGDASPGREIRQGRWIRAHRVAIDFFRTVVLFIGVLAALYCFYSIIYTAASIGMERM